MQERPIRPPINEPAVSTHVPYSHPVTKEIISTRSFEYVSVWRIGGRTFEGYAESEKCRWVDELNNTIKGFPAGVGFWSHLIRRRVMEYPESEYPDEFSRQHDQNYRRTFEGTPPMINELYLTVICRLTIDPALKMLSRFEKRTMKEVTQWQAQAIEQLEDINRKLRAVLTRYDADLLGITERNGRLFSEPAEFFGLLLNGKLEPVPVLDTHLYNYLPSSRPFFSIHGEQGELRGTDWSKRFTIVEVKDYPEFTKPGHLNALLKAPVEFILTQSFGVLTKAEGIAALTRQKKWLEDSKDYSQSQVEALGDALDGLAAGKFLMGDHHATLTIFGQDSDETLKNAALLIGDMAQEGVICRLVDRALVAAWWAQLPCNWKDRPRPSPITSQNFLCFSGMHNYLFGKPAGNPWGPAVTMLKTAGGTPYYLNFHASLPDVDDTGKRMLGNTSIIGQSGAGKTVLLGHLITQARKFGYTACIFDKDRGLQVAVMAMGGRYFPLELGKPTGWNYLKLDPTDQNRALMRKLTGILAKKGHEEPSQQEQKQISQAIDKLVEFIDHKDRRLSTLLQFLPAAPQAGDALSLHDRLERWCHGHENGWLLDNENDHLDLNQSDLFGFDLTEFLEQPEIRDAALTYLIYRTEQMIDGRRFAYVFDEVQHPLKVPYFQDLAQNKSRTIRKQNGVFIFATQEPDAILSNPVGRSLIHQSATALYLANPKATAEEYIKGFKLSEAQFTMVEALGEFSRQFVVKQGDSAVTASLDLSQCQDALLVFSGSADMAEIAEACIAEVGNDPADWLPLYLERARAIMRK